MSISNHPTFETIFNELLNLMQLRLDAVPAVEIDCRTELEIYYCTIDRLLDSGFGILDILGRYYPGSRKVVIYDLLIRIHALKCGIPYRILYEIVLCHELAHAATHLGLDQAGKIWSLFGTAHSSTVEYFAQIYTHLYYAECEKLDKKEQYSGFTAAMAKLSRTQPRQYQTYLRNIKKDISSINNSLLQARLEIEYPGAEFHLATGTVGVKPFVRFWCARGKDKCYMEMQLLGSTFKNDVPVLPLAVVNCTFKGTFNYQNVMWDFNEEPTHNAPDLLPFFQKYNDFYVLTLKLSDIHVDANEIQFCETHNSSPLLNPIGRTRAGRILVSKAQDAAFVAYLKKPGTLTEYYISHWGNNSNDTATLTWFV